MVLIGRQLKCHYSNQFSHLQPVLWMHAACFEMNCIVLIAYEETCLILAVYFGHTETVRYLVGLPEINVNHKDDNGYTAVLAAAGDGDGDVMQVLIDAGADMVKNKDAACCEGVGKSRCGSVCHRQQSKHMSFPCVTSHRDCTHSSVHA